MHKINNKMYRDFFIFLQISQHLHTLFWPESIAEKQTEANKITCPVQYTLYHLSIIAGSLAGTGHS